MENRVCVHCGRSDPDGWYSKSGYCKACAKTIYTEEKRKKKKKKDEKKYDGKAISSKDWTLALVLCIFTGWLGGHRFYTRRYASAVIWLFTAGVFGIGVLYDFVEMLAGNFVDADGAVLIKDVADVHARREAVAAMEKHASLAETPDRNEKSKKDFFVRVAGVTYENDDGSSRQKILKRIYEAHPVGEPLSVSLDRYEYGGKLAFRALVDGDCIGNVEAMSTKRVAKSIEENRQCRLEVDSFVKDENDDEYNPNGPNPGETVYFAKLIFSEQETC